MTALVANAFGGIAPKVSPRLLSDTQAQIAQDVDLRHGYLAGLPDVANPSSAVTFTKTPPILSIYRYGQTQPTDATYWFNWTTDVDVAMGLLVNDTDEFTYFTGDGYPKLTFFNAATGSGSDYPVADYQLGMPIPDTAPTLAATGTGTGAAETRAYVVTYVAKYLSGARIFESAPGPASEITIDPGQGVDLSGLGTAAPNTGSYPTSGNYLITHKRIYRTVSGTTGDANFFFVAEIAISSGTYSDTSNNTEIAQNVALSSTLYDYPPVGLTGIINTSNGMMAGFSGRDWYVCEPNQPHAWPGDYRKTLDHNIVMHRHAGGNAVVVATDAFPYMIYGTSPSAMTQEKLPFPQACVSKRSMVSVPGGAMYASPDGICMVGANGYDVVTKELITREQWQAYKPESMHAYWYEGIYIAFYDTGSVQGAIMFNPASGELRTSTLSATAGFVDPQRGALYLAIGSALKKWMAGSAKTFTWASKDYQLPRPANMVAAKVLAASYPVTLKTYADGVLKDTLSIASERIVKLSGGFKARTWKMELSGSANVYQAAIGTSVQELSGV